MEQQAALVVTTEQLRQQKVDNEELNRTDEEWEAEMRQEEYGNGKTYTQAEVNEIIRERLRRERAKTAPTPEEAQAAEMAARELRLSIREFLIDAHMPVDDILNFFDNMKIDTLNGFEWTFYDLKLLAKKICKAEELNEERRLEALSKSAEEKAIRNEYDLAGVPYHLRDRGISVIRKIFDMGGRP